MKIQTKIQIKMHGDVCQLLSNPISADIVNFISCLATTHESIYIARSEACFDELKSEMALENKEFNNPPF